MLISGDFMKNFFSELWAGIVGFFMNCGTHLACIGLTFVVTAAILIPTFNTQNDKLDTLEELINYRFVEEPDISAMHDAAAEAMVNAMGDRWSYYMTAEEFESYQKSMKSEYVGIGVTIQTQEDESGFYVVKVAENGPADQAGIQVGDIIVGADEQYVAQVGLDTVSGLIAGEKGSQVQIHLLRGEESMTVTVTRDTVLMQTAAGAMLEDKIGLVTIFGFESRSASDTIAVIKDLQQQGAEKLIFDVRNNPGGYASEMVSLLDYLLPEGAVFRTESSFGNTAVEESDAACLEMPMAVLVNAQSYSAAELFAAALQEYEWATVVGQQTFGKGYYQSTFELGDGSAVTLSIGKYYTPKGKSLIGVGVTPDIVKEVDDETAALIYANQLDPMEDPQILAAIDALKSGN